MLIKCEVCGKDFEAERSSRKTCGDICRQKLAREKVIVTKPVQVTVTKPLIVTGEDLIVTEEVIVTPEIEKKLEQIYKEFEKTYNGRTRGSAGNTKIPDIKCQPHYVDGKRVLTEWEKAALRGDLV